MKNKMKTAVVEKNYLSLYIYKYRHTHTTGVPHCIKVRKRYCTFTQHNVMTFLHFNNRIQYLIPQFDH